MELKELLKIRLLNKTWKEVARSLSISRQTLYKWINDDKEPKISVTQLNEFLEVIKQENKNSNVFFSTIKIDGKWKIIIHIEEK